MNPERYSYDPDSELSADQIAALEAGPGRVINPAGLFLTPASELPHLNNFFMYFESGVDSFIIGIYREQPYRKRFSIIYPDLTAQLEAEVASGHRFVGDFSFMDNPTGRLFAMAYDLMRDQVDLSDPQLISDGKVNNYLLWG